jgi:Domain of unknown function DUF29
LDGTNKVDLKHPAGHDDDFALWSAEQAALIRAGNFDRVDLENVAEEIESLGRSQKHEVRHWLTVLMTHLLKWERQPEHRSRRWASAIRGQRHEIMRQIEDSPSLRSFPAQVFAREYPWTGEKASEETTIYLENFPETCPYSVEQILDPGFLPGGD